MRSKPVSASSTWRNTPTTNTSPGQSAPASWMARSCASGNTRRSCGTGGRRCGNTSTLGTDRSVVFSRKHSCSSEWDGRRGFSWRSGMLEKNLNTVSFQRVNPPPDPGRASIPVSSLRAPGTMALT